MRKTIRSKKIRKHVSTTKIVAKSLQGANGSFTSIAKPDIMLDYESKLHFLLGFITVSIFVFLIIRIMKINISTLREMYFSSTSIVNSLIVGRPKYTPHTELSPATITPITLTPTPFPTISPLDTTAELQYITVSAGDNFSRIASRICHNEKLYDYLYRMNGMTALHEGDVVKVRCDGK